MHRLLDNFLKFLEVNKKLSVNTLESYRSDINQYIEYINSIGLNSFKKTNQKIIIKYLNYLKENGKSNATISRNIASLRSFYKYLFRNNQIKENSMLKIESPKLEKKKPKILSNAEIVLLLSQPDDKDLKGFRDKTMLIVLYSTGMRVSELVSLNISDIDMESSCIICNNKGKIRDIPIDKITLNLLKKYIETIRPSILKNKEEQALFLNANGRRLTRQGFWKILKYYQEKAKIDKEITPHMLRHSFAFHLVENGTDAKKLKEILGHSDISFTNLYYNMTQQ